MTEARANSARSVAVITVARSDYGILRPVLDAIRASDRLVLQLIVTGMHLSPEHGLSVEMIERDGYEISARVPLRQASDQPVAVAEATGKAVADLGVCLDRLRPDWVMLLGDRTEVLAGAVAALPLRLPIVHLHGGERTEGAIDEACRHAITKMSHLHCVATEGYGRRVAQLGEEPWRIHVTGSPAVDNIAAMTPLPRDELMSQARLPADRRFVLMTYHPVTLTTTPQATQIEGLREAVLWCIQQGLVVVSTCPNADAHYTNLLQMMRRLHDSHPEVIRLVDNLGTHRYLSAMAHAEFMLGNSSSGLIEAGSFALPVINIGDRQLGRARGPHVIDVGYSSSEIIAGMQRSMDDGWRSTHVTGENIYGDGQATGRIVKLLEDIAPGDARIIQKRFFDVETTT